MFQLIDDRYDTRFVAPFESKYDSGLFGSPFKLIRTDDGVSQEIRENSSNPVWVSTVHNYSLRNSQAHSNKPSVGNTNLLDWKLIFSRNLKPKSQGVSYRQDSSWDPAQPPEERIGKTSLCLCEDYLLIRFGPLKFDQLKRFLGEQKQQQVFFTVDKSGIYEASSFTYRFLRTRKVVGWMQLVDQVVLPPSLQIEMEKRPKLARTRLMAVPSSHSISSVEPSHPYLVLLSDPAKY